MLKFKQKNHSRWSIQHEATTMRMMLNHVFLKSLLDDSRQRDRSNSNGSQQMMVPSFSLRLGLFLLVTTLLLPRRVEAVRSLQIVSPLQALTIWDPPPPLDADAAADTAADTVAKTSDDKKKTTATAAAAAAHVVVPETPRHRFLPKFRAGVMAEVAVRQDFAKRRKQSLQASAIESSTSSTGAKSSTKSSAATTTAAPEWAQKAAATQGRWQRAEERRAEQAFVLAVKEYQDNDEESEQKAAKLKMKKQKNPNQYQFVGVINNPKSSSSSPITWYARKKPSTADWSVRLVHVNRRAIWKDLFNQGKIDVFAKYENTGKKASTTTTTTSSSSSSATSTTTGGVEKQQAKSHVPIITSQYTVRPRSWKNLWNFSPKHVITDSSGMYWRERRLRPGLYTDGNIVYEASYRYRDGRNGMHPLSTYEQYLASPAVSEKQKKSIQKRLQTCAPSVVLEE